MRGTFGASAVSSESDDDELDADTVLSRACEPFEVDAVDCVLRRRRNLRNMLEWTRCGSTERRRVGLEEGRGVGVVLGRACGNHEICGTFS